MDQSIIVNPKNSFILTGATGWVGRNFLNELQKIIPINIFNEKVFALEVNLDKFIVQLIKIRLLFQFILFLK